MSDWIEALSLLSPSIGVCLSLMIQLRLHHSYVRPTDQCEMELIILLHKFAPNLATKATMCSRQTAPPDKAKGTRPVIYSFAVQSQPLMEGD